MKVGGALRDLVTQAGVCQGMHAPAHGMLSSALAVGYQDAFGFSKMSKRTTGQSPREFRDRVAAERQHAHRCQEA